ncbi:hypothetical protein SAMN02949497_2194 [Methylomagnum ishizawai]|uniref:CRISPR-associated protein Csx10 n=1 Tax=Methylomagnum ishizawai TaxID=1760988 RepID=A0A1Y6CW26_9GAMM|nr:hypothetical protein [Methylomagnum ishizawai]SMF94858.1 hypothetical protein SAMN02949497_2194 [Methylomagnum ishizawai]
MGRFSLRFELLDEVVISSRAASAGGQPGLDYLPGANLLGAVAAVLYRTLSRRDAWTLFHSGQVRFGNALPALDGEPAWPLPLCWHRSADQPGWCERGRIRADHVHNLMHGCPDVPPPATLPLPQGYVALSGQYLKPKMLFRMKTVVSRENGHPAEERTFGYESLAEGQHFLGEIAYDAEVATGLVTALETFFAARPILHFGRSRSAQYGRVRCEPVAQPLAHPPRLDLAGPELSLWLLSDLAAYDRHGFPTLTPAAEDLGLPPADPLPRQTFAASRAYSPYNGFHQLYGSERQVLSQGSVLAYRLREPLDAAAWADLTARVERGLGLHREAGLGRCALAPALLATRHPCFAETAPATPATPAPGLPDHPLARWLLDAAETRSVQGGMRHWAGQALAELDQLERNARRLNGLREDQAASPGRSQWGRVAEAARQATAAPHSHRRLREALFGDANAVCRIHPEDWNRPTANAAGHPLTYRDWLETKLAERPEDAPSAIGLLAELAQRRLAAKP